MNQASQEYVKPPPNRAPDVKNLDELIKLGHSGMFYTNIDSYMLYRIMPSLLELQRMVGLSSIKKGIFEMVIYYLQHLHLTQYESGLYSPMNPVSYIEYMRNEEAKRKEQEKQELMRIEQEMAAKIEEERQKEYERKKSEAHRRKYPSKRHREAMEYLEQYESSRKRPRKYTVDLESKSLSSNPSSSSSSQDFQDAQAILSLCTSLGTPGVPAIASPQLSSVQSPPMLSLSVDQAQLPPNISWGMNKQSERGDFLHMMITGEPGCGKTKLGEIFGNIISELQIFKTKVPIKKFSIAHRHELIAEYLGQTGPKTVKYLDKHRGGVVMIDEAYSLGDPSDKYCVECIDTILPYMSTHKDDIAIIFVGYKDYLTNRLLNMNHGMTRRIPWRFNIDKYSAEELALIFVQKVNDIGWVCNFEIKVLTRMISEAKSYFKFSGGDMENLACRCKMIESMSSFSKEISERRHISLSSVKTAIEEKKETDHVDVSMLYL